MGIDVLEVNVGTFEDTFTELVHCSICLDQSMGMSCKLVSVRSRETSQLPFQKLVTAGQS